MSERKVSLRVAAVGGDRLKAELRAIGTEGKRALAVIEGGAPAASRGLAATDSAAEALMARLTTLSARAAEAANSLRAVGGTGASVLARVEAATGVSKSVARSREDIEAYGRALDATRAKYNPIYAAISTYRAELGSLRQAHAAGAISATEYAAALSRLRQASLAEIGALKGRSRNYEDLEKSTGRARFQMVQLGYQLNDVGVSLASGQNPLMVLVQQGAQIAQIYGNGQGGVGAALRQVGQMAVGVAARYPLVTAAIVAGTAAIAGMTHEINETARTTVAFGDTALAVWQMVAEGIATWIKPAVDAIAPWFEAAWDAVTAGVARFGNTLINAIRVSVLAIGTAVEAIPKLFEAAWEGARSIVFQALAGMMSGVESFLGGVASGLNAVFGTDLAAPEGITSALAGLNARSSDAAGASGAALAGARGDWAGLGARAAEIWNADPMGELFGAISDRAQGNAARRAAEGAAGSDSASGGGGAGRAAGDSAGAEAKEDEALGLLDAIKAALAAAAGDATDLGTQIGDALVGAFRSAEDALAEFVSTGKLDVASLATSILGDFARIGMRAYLMGPLTNALQGALGGSFGTALQSAFVQHAGGPAGSGPTRRVSAAAFVTAPRLHDGMGALRADEYAAILRRGERVLSPRETSDYEAGRLSAGPTVINFNGVRDARSFRQSRTQIAADLSRAIAMGRRGI